jgi:hypothetical protein
VALEKSTLSFPNPVAVMCVISGLDSETVDIAFLKEIVVDSSIETPVRLTKELTISLFLLIITVFTNEVPTSIPA